MLLASRVTRASRPCSYQLRTNLSPQLQPFEKIPGPPHNERGTMDDLMHRWFSTDINVAYESYYKEFGPMVRFKIMGKDEVVLFDPEHQLQVFRNDNTVPHGPSGDVWPIRAYAEYRNYKFPLVMEDTWKATRATVQKDIFSPAAAHSYIPALHEPVARAVKVFNTAPIDDLMPYAAFDMFASAMVGKNYFHTEKIANVSKEARNDDADVFVTNAMLALQTMIVLTNDYSVEGQAKRDERLAIFFAAMDVVLEQSRNMVREMQDSQSEGVSYFHKLAARKEIPDAELAELISTFLFAGVDTTSNISLWLLINIARFAEVQEKLYQEIMTVVGNNVITLEHLEKMEYLKLVIRESHRYTPPSPLTTYRILAKDLELGGYQIPAGTKYLMATAAVQSDPKYVDDPTSFIPERWSKAAVQARKGTEKEIIDSLPLARPFGVGPRMCLGARLAEVEIKVFFCHLVRMWKLEMDPPDQEYKIELKSFTQAVPYPKMRLTLRSAE